MSIVLKAMHRPCKRGNGTFTHLFYEEKFVYIAAFSKKIKFIITHPLSILPLNLRVIAFS